MQIDTGENMETKPPGHPSHLFTVRVWQEDLGSGVTEWRGQVRKVSSGQIYYFRKWQALTALVRQMLAEAETEQEGGKPPARMI